MTSSAKHFEKHLQLLKLPYEMKDSPLSKSCYFYVHTEDESIKIRVSDHELPPSYGILHGQSDYEVTPKDKMHPESHGTWYKVINQLCKRFDLPVPATVKRLLTIDANEQKQQAEQKLQHQRQVEAEIKEQEYLERQALAWAKTNMPDCYQAYQQRKTLADEVEQSEYGSHYKIRGKKRRELRSKMNKSLKSMVTRYLDTTHEPSPDSFEP